MSRFDGKLVLVTGASRGIGEAIARAFGNEGAKVLLAAEDRERLDVIAGEIGGGAAAVPMDPSDPEACRKAVAEAMTLHGAPDVLVTSGEAHPREPILGMEQEEWDRVLKTNLTGLFAVTQEAARGMVRRRSGRIINVATAPPLDEIPGSSCAAGSKAAVVGFTKALARQIGVHGITVNAVEPGCIETSITPKLEEARKKTLTKEIALGRLGTPEEIAAACLFLASDDGSYVTGEVLNVSGGLYM